MKVFKSIIKTVGHSLKRRGMNIYEFRSNRCTRAHYHFGDCTSFIWPRKLPEIGSAVGQTLSEFKKSAKEVMNEPDEQDNEKNQVDSKKKVLQWIPIITRIKKS